MLGSINCQKIVVLGNPGVGKTSIIHRYIHNQFKESYSATLGFNIYTRYITIADKKVGLSIWDVGGQEAFKKFAFRYLVEADAAIFVADITQLDTVENLILWNGRLEQVINRKIPKIVLFNKIDLSYNIQTISEMMATSEIRKEFNGIVFASAKTGKNVLDIFSMIAIMLTRWDEEFGIPTKQLIHLNGAFEEETIPIIFFSNNKCDLCKPVLNRIVSLSADFPLNIKIINVDKEKEIVNEYGILSLPTIIIGYKTVVGDLDESFIRTIITDEYLRRFKR